MSKPEFSIENVVLFLIEKAYETIDDNDRIMKARRKKAKITDLPPIDFLNSPEAGTVTINHHKLQYYFKVALDIAERFGVGTKTLNSLVQEYINRFEEASWLTRGNKLPGTSIILGFVELGVSSKIIESLLGTYVKNGLLHPAIKTLNLLPRSKFTGEEVWALVDSYNNGASRSDRTEDELRELALDHLSSEEAEKISERIRKERKRFNNALDY